MEPKTIEAPRDNGNHAITTVQAIWYRGTKTAIGFVVEDGDRIIEIAGYRFKA